MANTLLLRLVWLWPCLPWLFGWGPAAMLRWQGDAAATRAGEYWRLFSASWVHLDMQHALLNTTSLLLVCWLCPPARRAGLWPLAVLPALLLPLLEAGPFAGASGVAYAWAMWLLLGWPAGRWRWLAVLLLVGKVAWQSGQGSLLAGHPVAHGAHWLGLLLATLLHLVCQIAVRPTPGKRQPGGACA